MSLQIHIEELNGEDYLRVREQIDWKVMYSPHFVDLAEVVLWLQQRGYDSDTIQTLITKGEA